MSRRPCNKVGHPAYHIVNSVTEIACRNDNQGAKNTYAQLSPNIRASVMRTGALHLGQDVTQDNREKYLALHRMEALRRSFQNTSIGRNKPQKSVKVIIDTSLKIVRLQLAMIDALSKSGILNTSMSIKPEHQKMLAHMHNPGLIAPQNEDALRAQQNVAQKFLLAFQKELSEDTGRLAVKAYAQYCQVLLSRKEALSEYRESINSKFSEWEQEVVQKCLEIVSDE